MAKQLVFYIDTNSGTFFGDNLPEAKDVAFPSDVVFDLELLNKDKLAILLQVVIQTYQILPEPLSIILSGTITFDKDVTDIPPEHREEEIKKFVELVPFQEICTHTYTIEKKTHVVVANNMLIDSVTEIFKKQNFLVNAVIPYSILQEAIPVLQTTVDINLIADKIDSFKQYSLTAFQKNTPAKAGEQLGEKSNKRLFLLIGVFVFLLLILLIVAVMNFPQQPAKVHTQSFNPATQKSVISPVISQSFTYQSVTKAVAGIATQKESIKMYYIHVGK